MFLVCSIMTSSLYTMYFGYVVCTKRVLRYYSINYLILTSNYLAASAYYVIVNNYT